jgi:glutamate-1-semialdehyde 2,1-aminomutase
MNTTESARLFERASKVLVEGVSSASRGPAAFGTYPEYMRRAEGAALWDVDGNRYIDWMLSFGALPMGHAHPRIVEVVREEVANGTHFATALEVEVEVAEMLVDLLPHADKVRFANTGTEAVMACIRSGSHPRFLWHRAGVVARYVCRESRSGRKLAARGPRRPPAPAPGRDGGSR